MRWLLGAFSRRRWLAGVVTYGVHGTVDNILSAMDHHKECAQEVEKISLQLP